MLPQRITALRKKSNMNQSQLAAALNISASAIGMYEQGRRVPSLEILASMAKLFHVSLDFLITGKEFKADEQISDNNLPAVCCPCRTCFWRSFIPK